MSANDDSEPGRPLRPADVGWACDQCRWWDAWHNGADKGLCRFKPPERDSDGDAVWPTTGDGDWCGSFEEVEA